jgi:hypothetical protein
VQRVYRVWGQIELGSRSKQNLLVREGIELGSISKEDL